MVVVYDVVVVVVVVDVAYSICVGIHCVVGVAVVFIFIVCFVVYATVRVVVGVDDECVVRTPTRIICHRCCRCCFVVAML